MWSVIMVRAVADGRPLAVAEAEREGPEEHGREHLHLPVRELLPQAYPRAGLRLIEQTSGRHHLVNVICTVDVSRDTGTVVT